MIPLPQVFVTTPLAHRALHGPGAPENSLTAIDRAIAGGYGIEVDLQLSRDKQAIVFHDSHLTRLTQATGAVCDHSAADLGRIALRSSTDTIPTLSQVLKQVAGRVPLLIEIKDQSGSLGPGIGPLELATADALRGYVGSVAVMSFNPHSVARLADLAPTIPRGLTTCAFDAPYFPGVRDAARETLRAIPMYDSVGASFISHDVKDLAASRVAQLKARGAVILCWTVRSMAAETAARHYADNITFEGYAA